MPSNSTKYAVDVLLNPEDFPSADKSVIWDTSSGSFALGNAPGGSGAVGESTGIAPKGTNQFFVTSQVNDGTQTIVSGSDTFVFTSLALASNDLVRKVETRAQVGNDTLPSVAFVTTLPHRTQATTILNPNETNYTWPRTTSVASSYEHIEVIRTGNVSSGQQTLMTLNVPGYKGSGSFLFEEENHNISGSFNYLKIEHMITAGGTTRTQECTHHFSWYRNASGNAEALRVNSIENIRSPINEVIIDPSKTTGSFSSDGGLVISIYHYNVDDAQHILKYLTI